MGRKAIRNIEKKILSEVMKETYKNGIAAVSTKEVARKLHISEPVIFAHFETKQNLMTKAFEEAWCAFPHTVAFPSTVKKEDDQVAFMRYKEKVNSALQNPIQLIYIADFINSRYYSYSEVLRVKTIIERRFAPALLRLIPTFLPRTSIFWPSGSSRAPSPRSPA